MLKGERLEILRVDSEGDYCVNKKLGEKDVSLWENNSWLFAAVLNSVQRIYAVIIVNNTLTIYLSKF